MVRSVISAVCLVSALCLPGTGAAQDFPGVETLMSDRERSETGIDRLSPSQLEALNQWLARYLTGGDPSEPASPVVTTAPVAPPAPTTPPAASAAEVPAAPVAAAAPAPAPATPEPRPYGAPPPEFEPYTSIIRGEFTGWTGDTRFFLENGEVYEQRRPGRWRTSLMNPQVRITKNFLGAYDLEIVSEGRSIGVRRLR